MKVLFYSSNPEAAAAAQSSSPPTASVEPQQQRPVRGVVPFRPVARLPLSTPTVRLLSASGDYVFEPRTGRRYPVGSSDPDDEAPYEPPRDLRAMAELAAQRVSERLEFLEQSPLFQELRRKVSSLENELRTLADTAGYVDRRFVEVVDEALPEIVRRLADLERWEHARKIRDAGRELEELSWEARSQGLALEIQQQNLQHRKENRLLVGLVLLVAVVVAFLLRI
jgi:hypothetical protein